MKNIRNENYSNAVNLMNEVIFNKNLKSINIFHVNIAMKKIFVDINSDSRVVKYKKTKLIRFNSIEVVEISEKLKKLVQIIKEQSDSIDIIK